MGKKDKKKEKADAEKVAADVEEQIPASKVS